MSTSRGRLEHDKGETKTGFAFELEEAVLDNMELVDALAEMQRMTPGAFGRGTHGAGAETQGTI